MPKKKQKTAVKPLLPSVKLYRRIAGVFLLLTILLLGVVLYLATVQASVLVATQEEPLERSFTARVMSEPQSSEDIPGAVFTESIDESRTFEVDGEGEEIPQKATGVITVVNESGSAQPLIATTRFLNQDGVLFRLVEGVTVPANGEIDARVEADVEGKEGEIGPSEFTIPGLNAARQEQVYGLSQEPMVGGLVRRSILTQAEVDASVEAMVADIESSLDTRWRTDISGQLDGAKIRYELAPAETDVAIGEETSTYTLRVQGVFVGIYYDRARLADIAELILGDYLPEGRVLVGVDPDNMVVTYARHSQENGTAHFNVDATGTAVLERTADVLDKENIIGLTAEEAERFLESQDTISEATVELKPFWVRRIPRLKDHITIEVVE